MKPAAAAARPRCWHTRNRFISSPVTLRSLLGLAIRATSLPPRLPTTTLLPNSSRSRCASCMAISHPTSTASTFSTVRNAHACNLVIFFVAGSFAGSEAAARAQAPAKGTCCLPCLFHFLPHACSFPLLLEPCSKTKSKTPFILISRGKLGASHQGKIMISSSSAPAQLTQAARCGWKAATPTTGSSPTTAGGISSSINSRSQDPCT